MPIKYKYEKSQKMDENTYRKNLANNKWNLMRSRSTIGNIYPSVEKIKIKLEFNYTGANTIIRSIEMPYYQNDKDFFQIDCINEDCVNSDLDLSYEIKSMIDDQKTILEGHKLCNGFQDWERFKARNYKCLAKMNFIIEIKYVII